MKTRKLVITAIAALTALSLSMTAFAGNGTQTKSGTRTQIKSGTCIK